MYDPRVFSFKFERHCVAWSYFVFYASIGISLRHFCKHSELFDFFTNSLFFFAAILRRFQIFMPFLRRFCGDFRFKSGSENQKWKPNFCLRKIGNPLCLLGFPDSIYLGCPVGLEPTTFRTTI